MSRAVRRAYRHAPWRDRLHLAGRWWSCPFAAVEAQVPPAGEILDLGCGHGSFALHLASAAPTRQVTGVDVDGRKIELARAAAKELGLANVQFEVVDPGDAPTLGQSSWDAITIVDVLYLLGEEAARPVLAAAAGALAPGGVLLVKEMDVRPRWKHELNRLQELTATRVLRITQGERVQVLPPDQVAAELAAGGLTVERQRLDRTSLHPHHLVIGRAR